jgi:hypothetical protein
MTALDEILATIRRLPVPERLALIERARLEAAEDTPKPAPVFEPQRVLTIEELLAARIAAPPNLGTVTLKDIESAIAGRCNW